ncbi:MAG: ferritin family protein [Sedimentisphaerales bacterium]|nr:ferritin family protein [Sedimentisphaerales bacterium]
MKACGRCTMDPRFSVFDVLQIAEAVETRTARSYLRVAERFADEERRGIFYNLANWRVKHRNTWRRIRRRYSEKTGEFGVFDPDNYVLSNPWTMAGLTGHGMNPNSHDSPSGSETREQILRGAIRRSRDIIIFYHGLKEFARNPDSRMMIDNMISEEHRHVRLLIQALALTQASAEDSHNLASVYPTESHSSQ